MSQFVISKGGMKKRDTWCLIKKMINRPVAIPFDSLLESISQKIHTQHGRAILVGGAVRDAILGIPTKDFDIEVYGVDSLAHLKQMLLPWGIVNEMGKSFAVLKLKTDDFEIDFSLPRLDIKIQKGHNGFHVTTDPNLPYPEAASRRDFTINSMGIDLISHHLLDPFHGYEDLNNKILRHVGPAFYEDPLRVYRAMQFVARFGLTIAPETIALCRQMDVTELPKERVFEEFKKMLLISPQPSIGLNAMIDLDLIRYFPELETLEPTYRQSQEAVWTQTLLMVDKMAEWVRTESITDPTQALGLLFTAICRNLDKHLIKNFLKRFTDDKKLIKYVLSLIDPKPKPILTGQHLLANGFQSGPQMGAILKAAFTAQLEGQFSTEEDAITWVLKLS